MIKITQETKFDVLYLWFLGGAEPCLIGTLHLVRNPLGVSLSYANSWLADGFALSEDLPLSATEHLPLEKGFAVGAVDDARPDRWGERVIQYIEKPSRLSLMEYLYYAGDDRFGALGVSTSDTVYLPRENGPLPRLENAQALSEAVAKIKDKQVITDIERRLLHAGGSFGGAKPKALIEIDGEQWVIKFFNGEPIDVPLIEHASMTLAAQADITVAETRVVSLSGENAIAVRRFDREGVCRIHCLSAGTALRARSSGSNPPDFSYPNLAQLLRSAGETKQDRNKKQMVELFRRMVFNILIDNTDDHEKNHALLMTLKPAPSGKFSRISRLTLAPAYDVLPSNSGQGHQEFGVGLDGSASTLENAMSQCAQFGLSEVQARTEVLQVIVVVNRWKQHFKAQGVTDADINELALRIDGEELLSQRRAFSVA